jgi:hypothetical protein
VIEKGVVKAATVHQEFRVFRRMLNVAVRKRLLPSNPCWGVEFPVAVRGLFRPHYMSWSEQQRIEAEAQVYLKNATRIITETGLRVYKELTPMKKEQVGDAAPSAGGREGVQEVLADETADERRSVAEDAPDRQRVRRFGTDGVMERGSATVLRQVLSRKGRRAIWMPLEKAVKST